MQLELIISLILSLMAGYILYEGFYSLAAYSKNGFDLLTKTPFLFNIIKEHYKIHSKDSTGIQNELLEIIYKEFQTAHILPLKTSPVKQFGDRQIIGLSRFLQISFTIGYSACAYYLLAPIFHSLKIWHLT